MTSLQMLSLVGLVPLALHVLFIANFIRFKRTHATTYLILSAILGLSSADIFYILNGNLKTAVLTSHLLILALSVWLLRLWHLGFIVSDFLASKD
jgi:hypothetical protein